MIASLIEVVEAVLDRGDTAIGNLSQLDVTSPVAVLMVSSLRITQYYS
jgi:hypothetical protein